jgi:hypothetical protein
MMFGMGDGIVGMGIRLRLGFAAATYSSTDG